MKKVMYSKRSKLGTSRVMKRVQFGFTMVELLITLSISAILAVFAQQQLADQAQENLAVGSAVYLETVANAAQQLAMTNFNNYNSGTAIPGVANYLKPTIAELKTLTYLPATFPNTAIPLPTRQAVAINVLRSGCPGATCTVQILACTTTPITMGGTTTRFDLASTMTTAQNGTGAQSLGGTGGGTLVGPIVSAPNPMGNVEGIVCGTGMVNTALYQKFVQIGDTRDPNLQGSLTVAGATTLNGGATVSNSMTVNGTTTLNGNTTIGPCVNVSGANGQAGFACQNGADVPAGYTGGVRSVDVVANKNIIASDNPAAFNGVNTNYALVTANNGAGAAEIRTSGRAAADRITPTGSYAMGVACSVTDTGSIAKLAGGTGLVVCQGGVWTALSIQNVPGAPCATEGAMAQGATGVALLCVNSAWQPMNSIIPAGVPGAVCANAGTTAIDTTNANQVLVCRQNLTGGSLRYMRLQDVTTQLTFFGATEVADGAVINKPSCQDSPTQAATPIIQMIPKVFTSSDGGNAIYAVDNGTSWTAHLHMGSGASMPAGSVAIAQVFCYFN